VEEVDCSFVGVANEGFDSLLPGLLFSESTGGEPEFDTWEDWRLISNPLSIPPEEGTGKPRLSTYIHTSADQYSHPEGDYS
jgi:hypothetical protein